MGRMKESIMTEPEFSETQEQHTWHRGMTLRDYFAAKAMQAFLSAGVTGTDYIPDLAYRYADAMMGARNNGDT